MHNLGLRAAVCGVGTDPDLVFRLSGTIGGGGEACSALSDIPWLSLDAYNGSNAGGTSTELTVTFDSTGLTPGIYTGNLCVTSNDPGSRPRQRNRPRRRAGDPDRPAADRRGADRPGCRVGPDACTGWPAAGCGGCCRLQHGDGRWLRPATATAGIGSAIQVPVTSESDWH